MVCNCLTTASHLLQAARKPLEVQVCWRALTRADRSLAVARCSSHTGSAPRWTRPQGVSLQSAALNSRHAAHPLSQPAAVCHADGGKCCCLSPLYDCCMYVLFCKYKSIRQHFSRNLCQPASTATVFEYNIDVARASPDSVEHCLMQCEAGQLSDHGRVCPGGRQESPQGVSSGGACRHGHRDPTASCVRPASLPRDEVRIACTIIACTIMMFFVKYSNQRHVLMPESHRLDPPACCFLLCSAFR